MEATTNTIHKVSVDASNQTHLILIVDGHEYRVRWEDCSDVLANATSSQREIVDVSPSGYGLHWPLLDEDLAVEPLLQMAEK